MRANVKIIVKMCSIVKVALGFVSFNLENAGN